jgi:hypothetical protein
MYNHSLEIKKKFPEAYILENTPPAPQSPRLEGGGIWSLDLREKKRIKTSRASPKKRTKRKKGSKRNAK